jgi:hypothetical protein
MATKWNLKMDNKPAAICEPSAISTSRVVLAFLISPATTPLILCIFTGGAFNKRSEWDFFLCLLLTLIYGLPFAYLGELLLGFPAWLLFKHFKIRSVLAFLAAGGIIGWLSLFLLGIVNGTIQFFYHDLVESRLGICPIIIGAVSAVLFRQVLFSPSFDLRVK